MTGRPEEGLARPVFPTPLHEQVASRVIGFFAERRATTAVVIVGSCARGRAGPDSDLDIVVFAQADERAALEEAWSAFAAADPLVHRLVSAGRFSALHLDVCDGRYEPRPWDDGGGPDAFELDLGNHLAYSAPVWTRDSSFADLRARWLPYYDEDLRTQRLRMATDACLNDLDYVAFAVPRGLHFSAFDRLYKALREFLQALFISRRVYPIAYDKWIREQVCDLLGEPDVYAALPGVLHVADLEGETLLANAKHLRGLVTETLPAP